MQVSKEEILHIANLANLTLEENEVQQYLDNLQEILDFANIVNNANTENLDITIGANEAKNVFRKDELEVFEDNKALLSSNTSNSSFLNTFFASLAPMVISKFSVFALFTIFAKSNISCKLSKYC